jgi:PAP2 superfamily
MNPKIYIGLILLLASCQNPKNTEDYKEKIQNPKYYYRAIDKVTEVIIHDIFSPPVASRIYIYPSIAAYESLLPESPDFQTLAGQLRDLKPLPKPDNDKTYCYTLASIHAYLTVAKKLIFSEEKIEKFEAEFYKELKDLGIPNDVYERSMAYGAKVAKHVLDWASKDNYKETRTFPKYTIQEAANTWKPTPPSYMEGIEPSWNKIRPFLLDSASQFAPTPPTPFSADKNSAFYKEALEVYETFKKLSTEEKAIANFWDCNPYVSHVKGHAMYAAKKITPGGHWIGITQIITRQTQKNCIETMEALVWVSLALAEGFISCWDEKWRSVLIRPETYINQYIDEEWQPLLQTPPFPEYTSGHSVISNASAEVLTHLVGDNIAYTDSVEVKYGLPVRDFKSFRQAASEAAISRLYGGIHYMPAINNGSEQGKKIGQFIVKKLKTRKK